MFLNCSKDFDIYVLKLFVALEVVKRKIYFWALLLLCMDLPKDFIRFSLRFFEYLDSGRFQTGDFKHETYK